MRGVTPPPPPSPFPALPALGRYPQRHAARHLRGARAVPPYGHAEELEGEHRGALFPARATTGMLLFSVFPPGISLAKAAGSARAEPMKNTPHPPLRRSGRVSPAVRGRLGRAIPSSFALIPGGPHLSVGPRLLPALPVRRRWDPPRVPGAVCGRRVAVATGSALRLLWWRETGAEGPRRGLGGRALPTGGLAPC